MLEIFIMNCEAVFLHIQYKNLKMLIQQNSCEESSILNIDFQSKCIKKKLEMKKLYEIQSYLFN